MSQRSSLRRRLAALPCGLLLVAAVSVAQAQPITFLTARAVDFSALIAGRTVCDIDGDGDEDIVGPRSDGALFAFMNDGGVYFPMYAATGEPISCVASGDVNGDGRDDIVASGPSVAGGRIAVMISQGTSLASPVFVPTDAAGIVDVQLGDLDGDGDLDLVAVNNVTRRIHRLFNDGTGAFSGLASADLPGPVSRVWVADFTGDGRLDLLSGLWPQIEWDYPDQDSSRLMRNLGGGAFAAPRTCGLRAAHAIADFDGDGTPDAFVDEYTGYRGIARGRGDGTFDPPIVTTTGFYSCTEPFATPIDLDRDGRFELATGNGSGCTPSHFGVFRVDGSLHMDRIAELFGVFGFDGIVTDTDSDGWPDLVLTNAIHRNFGGRLGGTRIVSKYDMTPGDPYEEVQDIDAGDLSGDGRNDLIVSSNFYTGAFFVNAGDGNFLPGTRIQPESYIRSTVLADLDGDGDRDALMLHNDSGMPQHLYAWLNDGAGHTASVVTSNIPPISESPFDAGYHQGLVVADFDGDGDLDALSRENTTGPRLFLNDGAAHFTMQSCALPLGGRYFDLDGDGLPDRLSASGDSVAVEHAIAVGSLGPPVKAYAGGTVSGADFADVTGDGIPDAVCLLASGSIATRFGAPGGAWGALVPSLVPAGPSGYVPVFGGLGDLDGDGALDVLVTGAGTPSVISVHRNLGAGLFGDRGDSYSSQPTGTLIADLDGDGAGELIGAGPGEYNYGSHAINILFNAGPAGGATPALVSNVSAEAIEGVARLVWQLGGDGVASVTLERRTPSESWAALASLAPDGLSRVSYEDRAVVAGARYGYRLIADGAPVGEVWVTIPARAAFAIERVWPNPLTGDALRVRFAVDRDAPVEVELLDVTGRRVASERIAAPRPGSHEVQLGRGRTIRPGLYFVSVSQSGRRAESRVAVTR